MTIFNCELEQYEKFAACGVTGDLQTANFFCHLILFRGKYFCNKPKTIPMIHESKLFELVQAHNSFSLQFVAKSGELVTVDECSCTSFHSSGKTMKIKLPNGQFRTVNRKTVTRFNGEEVFL